MPNRIGQDTDDEADTDAQESQANLPEIESIMGLKDKGESPEEEIKNAQKDCREDAEVEAHGLEDEKLKRSYQRLRNRSDNRFLLGQFHGRFPSCVAR